MKAFAKTDKVLLFTAMCLVVFGIFVFGSAALGVLSVDEGKFYSILENQLIYALLGGLFALFLGTIINFKLYQKFAYYLFGIGLFITSLVFVPGIQMYHGGAHRWIHVGPLSIQPSELLKFVFVIAVAAWCTKYSHHFKSIKYGLVPYLALSGIVMLIMLLQPDFGTLLIMLAGSFVVYFVGGASFKHIGLIVVAAVLGFILLVSVRPYMMERVLTFFDASHDARGSSWQLNQSLIAIGSGGVFGRGYGQSVQKYNYLPEPIGDSVFAVLGEELGTVGILILFLLYGIVIVRGLRIALGSESQFGRLLAVGIITIFSAQIILNVGSMIGILPLAGVPLPLVSHGGTALMAILFQIGVVLNISRQSHYSV
jgi:cell division protein FtsW